MKENINKAMNEFRIVRALNGEYEIADARIINEIKIINSK